MTVDLITFCYPGDIHQLHKPGILEKLVYSHEYTFDNIIVVHQRCRGIEYRPFDFPCRIVESESHPNILTEFNIPEHDEKADYWTHGPDAAHYWKWHVVNHLIGLKESDTDHVVFSDCDCVIRESAPGRSWVEEAVDILQQHSNVLIVGPGDGGHMMEARIPEARLTRNVSQQMFCCGRERLKGIDFNIPWDWEFLAPGAPMQEFYYMLEGRIFRYLHKYGLWRAVLPDKWRYWQERGPDGKLAAEIYRG